VTTIDVNYVVYTYALTRSNRVKCTANITFRNVNITIRLLRLVYNTVKCKIDKIRRETSPGTRLYVSRRFCYATLWRSTACTRRFSGGTFFGYRAQRVTTVRTRWRPRAGDARYGCGPRWCTGRARRPARWWSRPAAARTADTSSSRPADGDAPGTWPAWRPRHTGYARRRGR